MHIHLLMKTLLNLPVSPREINFSLSSEAFMVSKDFQTSLQKMSSTFFKTPLEQGFALVYIDDILLLSDSKEHMFNIIEQLHIIR